MTPDECVAAVSEAFPELAAGEPRELDHGWSFFTFRLNDLVWRFPRTDHDAALLERESRLLPAIAPRLDVAIAVPEWLGTWQGRTFAGYRFIDGIPVTPAALRRPDLQIQIGHFLTQLHGVPLKEVAPHVESSATTTGWKQRHSELLAAIEIRTGGLLDAATIRTVRRRIAVAVERFDFTPVIAHADLGFSARPGIVAHLLADDGRLVGVLDFSEMAIEDAAIDFSGILGAAGWEVVDGVSAAYGGELGQRFRERVAFHYWIAPLHDILYGLDTHDDALVAEKVAELERRLWSTGTVT